MSATIPHGTISRYGNQRCRCEECRAAWAEYHRSYRRPHVERRREAEARGERYVAAIDNHGITGWCTYSCRCPICTAAHRATSNQARDRRRKLARVFR